MAVRVPTTPTDPPMNPLCQWCLTLCSAISLATKSTTSDPGRGGNPSPALKLRTPPLSLSRWPPPPPLPRRRRVVGSVLITSFGGAAPTAAALWRWRWPLAAAILIARGCPRLTKASAAGFSDHAQQRTRRVRTILRGFMVLVCMCCAGLARSHHTTGEYATRTCALSCVTKCKKKKGFYSPAGHI